MQLSMDLSTASAKQLGLLDTFQQLIEKYNIRIYINEPLPETTEPLAVDVEHDEQGAFVCCGLFIPSINSYYGYTDLVSLCRIRWGFLKLIAHNWNGDFDCLRSWGVDLNDNQLVSDTMLGGHILDSSLKAYGLKDMAKRELGIEYPSYDDIVGRKTAKQTAARLTLDKQPIELVTLYNAMDCYATAKLYLKQAKDWGGTIPEVLSDTPALDYFNEVEKPISKIFEQMSTRGIHVDLQYLDTLKKELEAKRSPLEREIKNELGSINLNSPKQLLEALNAKEIFPTFKGKPSTDKRALQKFAETDIVSTLLIYSEIDTLLSVFVNPYLERAQEVVHPFYNQCGTRTGRLSCSNPNLLQIPRRTENGKLVRRMFIPRDGMVMGDCDYGQIEPRVLAHLSKDSALCGLFNEGTDFHAYTASRLGIDRERAKILNLSVGYRATFKSVSAQLRCSNEEAQKEINRWWALFPTLRRWQDRLIYESKISGYCTTLLGRRIRVEDLSHGNSWRREGAERQLINNITQASATEIMKMAMIGIIKDCPDMGLLVQVYDELLFESEKIEEDIGRVQFSMENAVKLEVPLTVECKTGANWAECH